MNVAFLLSLTVVAALGLGYKRAPLWMWTLLLAVVSALVIGLQSIIFWTLFAIVAGIFNVPPIRARLITKPLLNLFRSLQLLPNISQTERIALEAGSVGIEGEFFSGNPDFNKIMAEVYPELTVEEKAFLEGPVETLCKMVEDWRVIKERDLSVEAWDYLKKERFFGMIIPKEYGGLGFSPLGHSAVISKFGSRSLTLAITAAVPNSLGPAELLIHYGTKAQKDHYLPRLARGEDIPCFALTEPEAGSDAGSITSNGVVFKDDDGKLSMRLNWNKRYITLASRSTVLGLAFKLRDPEKLLGKGEDLGINCALIPTKTPGVTADKRHDPLNVPFLNCPTQGKDVVVAIDAIIGGMDGLGRGWQMLMECLSAGRGITLPSQSAGGAKMVARAIGAYASLRTQFGLSVGKFEGVEEPLARINGFTYVLEAIRTASAGAQHDGEKPAVVSAIAKYNATELLRRIVNDGMDVQGGAAISRGPRNILANGYMGVPISITVEGANILTRTLIVFGQGVLRAHPYAYREVKAMEQNDVATFDEVFWSHMGHIVSNAARAVVLSLSFGLIARSPVQGPTAKYIRKLMWASASFAVLTDLLMGALGGDLKRRGKITGRGADILSWLFICTATLRKWQADGKKEEDLPLIDWIMQYGLHQIQEAFDGIYNNLDVRGIGWLFKGPIRWWSRLHPLSSLPSDALGATIAKINQKYGEQRDRLSQGIFIPQDVKDPLGRLDHALRLNFAIGGIEKKIRMALSTGQIKKDAPVKMVQAALDLNLVSKAEAKLLEDAYIARNDAIQVDDFTEEEYHASPLASANEIGVATAKSKLQATG